MTTRPPFLAPFALLSTLGLLGIASLVPMLGPVTTLLRREPDLVGTPEAMLVALVLLQPALLTLAAVALGTWLAPKLGLRSRLAEWAQGERPRWEGFGLPLPAASLLGPGILAADLAFRSAWPSSFAGLGTLLGEGGFATRLHALAYGGIVEELLLRYGLMTGLVGLSARLWPHAFAAAPGRLVWPAIALAALAFAAGHLPGLAAAVPLDGVLVARTMLLNGAAGLVYGWLYWRRGLEHAMLAHAGTHVAFWLAGPPLQRLLA